MGGIIAGILAVIVIVQEIRIHRLMERLLLQACIPSLDLGPVRATAKSDDAPARLDTRRKIMSVQIPD